MMKVLHLVDTYLPLTEGWIYPQVVGDGTWRSQVGAVHRSESDYYPFPAVTAFTEQWPVWRRPGLRLILYRYPQIALFWLRSGIPKGGIDLVHCHFGDLAFRALPLARHLGAPLVTTFYGYDATLLPTQQPAWRRRYRELFSRGDFFLAEGARMKETLVALGCPREKVGVFHLGVDLERIPSAEGKERPDGMIRLLAAGSFREKKGLTYAVEAFARARRSYPRITLTVIGDAVGKDLGEKEKILGTVRRCGVEESVTFLGFQPHHRFVEELGKHDLFISPSVVAANGDSEGGAPVAITEASAAGVPVISTRHCDIPEVVLDQITGRLSAERDIDGLAQSILFFAGNPGSLLQYGARARRHIEENYNVRLQVKKLKGYYQDVLRRNGDPHSEVPR
ncbi:glycosyltransferase [Geomesophilobacter sediminis]|uniref:Glycosyltransferase n=1 Tax=Geomesophilobacter sediminis TaxID=2798584 RepID=A0A8J7M0B2_9BACT|nr:glycosyltransferase [Geomesophilobacter sediminis]MBJ6724272.1 glycosyltransferase [Geomesophilobacter sediminis]